MLGRFLVSSVYIKLQMYADTFTMFLKIHRESFMSHEERLNCSVHDFILQVVESFNDITNCGLQQRENIVS